MLILAIDSSTQAGTVSLIKEDRLIGESLLNLEQTHSQRLMPQVVDLIKSCNYQPQDLDGIGVTRGPGSFTGTRIGLATAKTLAQSLDLPVVGVSTLRVLAYSLRYVKGHICPVIDARGGRLFACLYRCADGLTVKFEEKMLEVEKLLDKLSGIEGSIYFVGEITNDYKQQIKQQLSEAQFMTDLFNLPRGGAVAEIARDRLQAGKADDLLALTPNYLKRSQAEIQWG